MLRMKTGNYGVGIWLARLPRWIILRTCPALLLLGGIAHATPIEGLYDKPLGDVSTLTRPANVQNPAKAATTLSSAATVSSSEMNLDVSYDRGSDGCAFSSNCYTSIKVPEPQSLVLVGSGLLSMAELIRRRLIR